MVYTLAASTLTVAAPLGCDTSPEGAEPTAPGVRTPSGVLVTGADEEMLVLEVTEANKVVVRLPRAEVGQGVTTAVAMMIAEELDARLADIRIPLAEARTKGNQVTGGSNSVRSLYGPARELAATARARLVTAASRRWHIPARRLRTRDTMVVAPDGRTATFGSLTESAARIRRPAVPAGPKPASEHRVIGKPATRIDARDIVTGKAEYAGDVAVAGAKPAVVARPPTLGGKAVSVDDRAARAMPGVLAVVRTDGGVAVVAESFHHAFKARDALRITWAPGPLAALSDAAIRSRLRAAVPRLGTPPRGSTQVEGEFEFAFVSHAPMEVLTAVADVRDHGAEMWFSSQTPMNARDTIASAVGLPASKVRVHVTRGGGSFGRRLTFDAAVEAALISKAAHRPVKLMWSRADDLRHGRMRPASHHRIRASHADGRVVAFTHQMASVNESHEQDGPAAQGGMTSVVPLGGRSAAAGPLPSDSGLYNFGPVFGDSAGVDLPLPLGAWRSVNSGTMRTAEEIVVDEVARSLGEDPVAFRRTTLRSEAAKAVLDKAASAGNWGRTLPDGHGQGVAVHEEYDSCVACLVEIDATDPENPRVTKVVMAADVGTAVNPSGLEAQLMGTAIDGISTVLLAGLHIDRGAVREGSFDDFRYARQRHAPLHFEAHIMPSRQDPGGAGELGVPAAAGAVANAYARATGTRPRRFPLTF
ncbi:MULTISPECIES: xanthine dehydrogenase family protein molybdopterin-binding subunit [Streptomyces]|uniref:Xanthine dehydrogenase family protein molybdopterin-binding subunit n=1 Tax=Streptomyces dengpaensis TaxID=2049881 RepID=A0ABM6T387_9ACTN|nr:MULTISPECIES: molybdopterin cofactor-binding domain-containing protein [Streptomyces]AVH61287.1 xanthine dehydrogenase family protein molybdopterin-binding subunit [Streptomyces dengpaensis]